MASARTSDRGAGFVEYSMIILLAVAIIAAVATAGFSNNVPLFISKGINCIIQQPDDCGHENTHSANSPKEENTSPSQHSDIEDPAAPGPVADSYECGRWQSACDFAQGAASEAQDLVIDAWEGARATGCLAHICSNEEFRETWRGLRDSAVQSFTDPLGTIEENWNDYTDGPQEDYANGHETRSVGRSVVLGISSVFGIGALKLLPDRNSVPEKPSRDYRIASEEAARRGDVSSAQRNANLADQAAQGSEAALRDNPDDPDLQDRAQQDRREADQAALEARGAEAISQMLEIPIGRELNGALNKYGTDIAFTDDPKMRGTAQYDPNTNTITIGEGRMENPHFVLDLVHEASHARREGQNENYPIIGYSREEYLKNQLENEADSQISEFQAAEELRSQGHNIPLEPREEFYNERYLHWLEEYEDAGVNSSLAEEMAAAGAREDLAEEIGNMINSVDGTPYREYYGNYWDQANGE